MKIIIIITFILMLAFGGCTISLPELPKKDVDTEISQWSDYYKEIANTKKCKENLCCMSGLRNMEKNDYKLADEDENCPEGFKQHMNLCLDTLIWCEPIDKSCAKEGEMISIMPTSTGEPGKECCEGLKSGGDYNIINDECGIYTDVAICINCPNGECGPGENKCNCPEDCE